MSSKCISAYAAVVVLLMTMAPTLFGQAFTSLTGVVTDPTGGVIPGASVVVTIYGVIINCAQNGLVISWWHEATDDTRCRNRCSRAAG